MRRSIISICCLILTLAVTACAQHSALKEDLSLKYLVREPISHTSKPPVVIIMHGYGSNEEDMFGLAPYFPENFLVVAARAPYPMSANGFQWFEKDRSQPKYTPVKNMIENSRDLLLKFIPEVVSRYHADASSVYVMGFSQGAIMSYEAGLYSPTVIKGIGVLSGVMPAGLEKEIKPSAALSKLRIFIAHGTADNILPYEDGKAGYDQLVKLGLHPEFHRYQDMAHTIGTETVTDLMKWLRK